MSRIKEPGTVAPGMPNSRRLVGEDIAPRVAGAFVYDGNRTRYLLCAKEMLHRKSFVLRVGSHPVQRG